MNTTKAGEGQVYLTASEVAEMLRVTTPTVRKLAGRGDFGKSIIVGNAVRIPKQGLDDFLKKSEGGVR